MLISVSVFVIREAEKSVFSVDEEGFVFKLRVSAHQLVFAHGFNRIVALSVDLKLCFVEFVKADSEQIVTDSMEAVAERVIREVKAENRPFDTVIKGVDDPWDVCLMQFFWLHTNASVSHNMRDFKNAGMFK